MVGQVLWVPSDHRTWKSYVLRREFWSFYVYLQRKN